MTNVHSNKTKRKNNKITIALTIIFIFSFLILINTFGNQNSYGDQEQEYFQVIIKAGDSLWSIAEEHTPEHSDLRETMKLIEERNNISSSQLFAGELIEIPMIY